MLSLLQYFQLYCRYSIKQEVEQIRADAFYSTFLNDFVIFFWDVFTARCTSAKRGIVIACRLSVCLSVCNVGEL